MSRDDTPSVTAPSVVVDGIRFAERGGLRKRGALHPGSPGSSGRLLFDSWM
jgi:hypothetical protein